jgi:hypothetical protein
MRFLGTALCLGCAVLLSPRAARPIHLPPRNHAEIPDDTAVVPPKNTPAARRRGSANRNLFQVPLRASGPPLLPILQKIFSGVVRRL